MNIQTEEQFKNIQERIDRLTRIAFSRELTLKESEYLDELGDAVYDYESNILEPVEDIDEIDLLRTTLKDGEISKEFVEKIIGEREVDKLLNEERELTSKEIQKLDMYFKYIF